MLLSVKTIESQVTSDLWCKRKTGKLTVFSVFFPGKNQVLPDGNQLKQCEKADNLDSWLNFKWKN